MLCLFCASRAVPAVTCSTTTDWLRLAAITNQARRLIPAHGPAIPKRRHPPDHPGQRLVAALPASWSRRRGPARCEVLPEIDFWRGGKVGDERAVVRIRCPARRCNEGPRYFSAFDLLSCDAKPTTSEPIETRKATRQMSRLSASAAEPGLWLNETLSIRGRGRKSSSITASLHRITRSKRLACAPLSASLTGLAQVQEPAGAGGETRVRQPGDWDEGGATVACFWLARDNATGADRLRQNNASSFSSTHSPSCEYIRWINLKPDFRKVDRKTNSLRLHSP